MSRVIKFRTWNKAQKEMLVHCGATEEMTIIGNIYENPELLEQGE